MRTWLGIDIGGTAVKIGVVDESGDILLSETRSVSFDGYKTPIMTTVSTLAEEILAKCAEKPEGIGVSATGQIDVHTGTVIGVGAHFGNWLGSEIKEILEDKFHLPVTVINDANAAALGEQCYGRAKGCENALVVTIGTGVGGGIVVGGRVIHGIHGAGGEIGHMVLNRDEGEACNCGKHGCVEQYCSATGIVRIAKKFLAASTAPSSLRSIEALTCKDVFDAGKEGDALALEILEQVYAYLGEFLANVCNVTDPEVVVLGGGVSKAGQPLLEGAQRYYKKYVFHACRETRFALASLGNDAGAYGAFKLVLEG